MKKDLKEAILDEMVVYERRILMSNKEYRKVEEWRKFKETVSAEIHNQPSKNP